MTLQFYQKEEARLRNALTEIEPGSDKYAAILGNLEDLAVHVIRTLDVEERLRYNDENNEIDAYTVAPSGHVLHLVQPLKGPAEEQTPAPEPESEPEIPEDPEGPIGPRGDIGEPGVPLTLSDVKAAFTAAARSGVKVAEIINDAGYAKLSDVPSELYNALMRALERKRNGED